jgi:hypothetical protein
VAAKGQRMPPTIPNAASQKASRRMSRFGAKPRYTLAELLARSDYSQPQPPEEREWEQVVEPWDATFLIASELLIRMRPNRRRAAHTMPQPIETFTTL